jgi:pterin-4a-carbinolamine dehydratase
VENLKEIMKEYFDDQSRSRDSSGIPRMLSEGFANDIPIVPSVMKWRVVTDPERLMRRFEFLTRGILIDFLSELFELEDEMGHNAKVTIDELSIDVEIYTRSIDCITDLDLEYTKKLDLIFEDVGYYEHTK